MGSERSEIDDPFQTGLHVAVGERSLALTDTAPLQVRVHRCQLESREAVQPCVQPRGQGVLARCNELPPMMVKTEFVELCLGFGLGLGVAINETGTKCYLGDPFPVAPTIDTSFIIRALGRHPEFLP